MPDNVSNFPFSTITTSPGTGGTSFNVTSGAVFPSGSFDLTIWPIAELPTGSNAEIARASVSVNTVTATRGQYGTSPQNITANNFYCAQMITSNFISQIEAAITAAASAAQTAAEAYALTAAQAMWPVGAIFYSANATNPNSLLGFGTWSQVAEGQTIFGFKSADANFGTLGGTGGQANSLFTHTHGTGIESIEHTHIINSGSHTHDPVGDTGGGTAALALTGGTGSGLDFLWGQDANVPAGYNVPPSGGDGTIGLTNANVVDTGHVHPNGGITDGGTQHVTINNDNTHTHTTNSISSSIGGNTTANTLPPYLVCYVWQRTA